MNRLAAERMRVNSTTLREMVLTRLYEADQYGYFEVVVDDGSLGWFFIHPRRAVYTTPEKVESDPVYGTTTRKILEEAIVKIPFADWGEFFQWVLPEYPAGGYSDAGVGKTAFREVNEIFIQPKDKYDAFKAIVKSETDDRRDQPATDAYDWMGGAL